MNRPEGSSIRTSAGSAVTSIATAAAPWVASPGLSSSYLETSLATTRTFWVGSRWIRPRANCRAAVAP